MQLWYHQRAPLPPKLLRSGTKRSIDGQARRGCGERLHRSAHDDLRAGAISSRRDELDARRLRHRKRIGPHLDGLIRDPHRHQEKKDHRRAKVGRIAARSNPTNVGLSTMELL
jgi:hypothetical protein